MWDSHYRTDIDRLERIQSKAARFINQDFHSRETGCVSAMLRDLGLPSLQERRRQLRLIFMFKVVEGLVPAVPADKFFTQKKTNKRQIKPKIFKDCVTKNIVDKSAHMNSRPYEVPSSKTDQYRYSYFVRTVEDWNHLENSTVIAASPEIFKNKLQQQRD